MLTVDDVAARFGVSPRAVYEWCEDEHIRYERAPDGSYLIFPDQFEADRDNEAQTRRRSEAAERLLAKRPKVQIDDEELAEALRARRARG